MFSVLLLISTGLNAQNVGINATGAVPVDDAILDINSANKGLLIPRVNIANLATIAPVTGGATTSLLVYNTNAATGLGYYYWDGNDWIQFLSRANVDNGLYYNTGASEIRLGGPLVENTTITQSTFSLDVNLNSTGDFTVQDNGVNMFQVRDDGVSIFGDDTYWKDVNTQGNNLMSLTDDGNDGRLRIYENGGIAVDLDANTQFIFNQQGFDRDFRIESDLNANMLFVNAGLNRVSIGTAASGGAFNVFGESYHSDDIYLRDGSVDAGDILVRIYDDSDDGIIDIYENNAYNIRLHGKGTSIFNEQGLANNDFRIESSGNSNMFFVDAGTNRIGVKTTTPTNVVDIIQATAIGATDVLQSQLNANEGGAFDAIINSATNGYNTIEAITNGTGSPIYALQQNTTHGSLALMTATNSGNDQWGIVTLDNILALNYFVISDNELKRNVTKLMGGLDVVKALNPVSYNFKEGNDINANSTKLNYGFIAQEVDKLLPNLVAKNSVPVMKENGPDLDYNNAEMKYSTVNYVGLIPVLTNAIQEQEVEIEAQNTRIERLEKIVEQLQGNK
tara:strand:+ start:14993 stop:16681 length:1689 start_codon:yes stop_codon:yes gene_type:complete